MDTLVSPLPQKENICMLVALVRSRYIFLCLASPYTLVVRSPCLSPCHLSVSGDSIEDVARTAFGSTTADSLVESTWKEKLYLALRNLSLAAFGYCVWSVFARISTLLDPVKYIESNPSDQPASIPC